MRRKILTTMLLGAASLSAHAAVSLSSTGKGDLVILPYYTVKNNLNTAFTVTNHNATQGKLISVAFKESKNNHDVMYYNVFLKPNSSWAVGVGAVQSTIPDHTGEPSVVQVFDSLNSTQCAPFLSTHQEFLPYAYEEIDNSSLSLERAQEGHIEVYELGNINPNNPNLDLDDCQSIQENININQASINQHLLPASGDISATASLLNVSEGTSYSYNGVAFNDFSDAAAFTFDEYPYHYDFDDASTSALIVQNGMSHTTQWGSGPEAMNALIASHQLGADFTVESGNNSQTEVVFSLPGKIYMNSGNQATAPFTQTYDSSTGSCETAAFSAYDRNGNMASTVDNVELCWATNVLKIGAQNPSNLSDILMSQHQNEIKPSSETGRLMLSFDHNMQSLNGFQVEGLPVLGFAIQRYTNANAAPGLMAQYGSLFKFSLSKSTTAQ